MSIGRVSSRPAATATWLTASAKTSLSTSPGGRRHRRQGRVVLDRQRRQAEPRVAAGDRQPRALGGDLHRVRRQRAGDLGEQAARAPGRGRPRWRARPPRRGPTPRSRSRRPTADCRRPRAGSRRGPAPTAAAAGCAPSRRRRRRAPHVPPGTSSLDPPDLVSVLEAPAALERSPASVRCSSCLLRYLRGKPRPSMSVLQALWARDRSFPTQSVVQGFIEITNSSSSSHVWKLGTTPLRAAQRPNGPVGRLWVVSVFLLSTRGHLDGCAPTSRAVHPLSPASPCSSPQARAQAVRRTGDAGRPRRSPGVHAIRAGQRRGTEAAGAARRPPGAAGHDDRM